MNLLGAQFIAPFFGQDNSPPYKGIVYLVFKLLLGNLNRTNEVEEW